MNQHPPNPDALEAACLAAIQNESPEATFADEEDRLDWLGWMRPVVSAYLAVAQPEVTSVEELEALPHETVIRDNKDFVFEKIVHHDKSSEWWSTTDFLCEDLNVSLPARVLYLPEVKL